MSAAQRARNADARLLPARELMRKTRQQLGWQADAVGKLPDAFRQIAAALRLCQQANRLGDAVKRGVARIEAVGGILNTI